VLAGPAASVLAGPAASVLAGPAASVLAGRAASVLVLLPQCWLPLPLVAASAPVMLLLLWRRYLQSSAAAFSGFNSTSGSSIRNLAPDPQHDHLEGMSPHHIYLFFKYGIECKEYPLVSLARSTVSN
jgi:uncharacterized protein involved in outer membrane biogenesis